MIVHVRSEHARGASAVRRLRAQAQRYLEALGQSEAELSILVVGDAAIRRLNRRWRGKDRATDVLSFPAAGPGRMLGDVVVSLDTARRAARGQRALGAELDRYLAHGLLHLLGHDHERAGDARRMARAEDALVGEGMVTAAGSGSRIRSGSASGSRPFDCAPSHSVRAEPFDSARCAGYAQDRLRPRSGRSRSARSAQPALRSGRTGRSVERRSSGSRSQRGLPPRRAPSPSP